MKTLTAETEISSDRMLRIELPCDLPPGPVEVVVVVQPRTAGTNGRNWDDLYGLGREIWQGIDARQYVQDLRQDREAPE